MNLTLCKDSLNNYYLVDLEMCVTAKEPRMGGQVLRELYKGIEWDKSKSEWWPIEMNPDYIDYLREVNRLEILVMTGQSEEQMLVAYELFWGNK